MTRDNIAGLMVLAALGGGAAGLFLGSARPKTGTTGQAAPARSRGALARAGEPDLVSLFRDQENQVSRAILELTIRQGEVGADSLGLAGRIGQLEQELGRIESRRSLAETEQAAIAFPGDQIVAKLRAAVGELEAAIGKATALNSLLLKVNAAISAWRA